MGDGQLQQDIVGIMEKSFNQLVKKLRTTKKLVTPSLLESSVNKFMKCILLITSNQMFMKNQNNRALILAEMLKYEVNCMPQNFN